MVPPNARNVRNPESKVDHKDLAADAELGPPLWLPGGALEARGPAEDDDPPSSPFPAVLSGTFWMVCPPVCGASDANEVALAGVGRDRVRDRELK